MNKKIKPIWTEIKQNYQQHLCDRELSARPLLYYHEKKGFTPLRLLVTSNEATLIGV